MRTGPFRSDTTLEAGNYIGIWTQGLLGDGLVAACKFQHLRESHPGCHWIVVHSYEHSERLSVLWELWKPFIDDGTISDFFIDPIHRDQSMPSVVADFFRARSIPAYNLCAFHPWLHPVTAPEIGIPFRKARTPKKALLFRRSTWHGHFTRRNRSADEWLAIEKRLLESGLDLHLVGLDDEMPTHPEVHDHRGKFSIRELLEFATDASFCISPTTFLPVWTQFICPTIVLAEGGDVASQYAHWKWSGNYHIVNIDIESPLAAIERLFEVTPSAFAYDSRSFLQMLYPRDRIGKLEMLSAVSGATFLSWWRYGFRSAFRRTVLAYLALNPFGRAMGTQVLDLEPRKKE